MIVLDVNLNNFYAFKNFHANFSYPKKIVDSYIEEEYLSERPNFRYRKVVVLMGANATGKTSLGRILSRIFYFIDRQESSALYSLVGDATAEASFTIDFLIHDPVLYRVSAVLVPSAGKETERPQIRVRVKKVNIGKTDSYETCAAKLDKIKEEYTGDYVNELKRVPNLGWAFQLNENFNSHPAVNFDSNKKLDVLRTVLHVFDPSIRDVRRLNEVENSFVISLGNRSVIIQDGKIVNPLILSTGTYEGIFIADMLCRIRERENGFYYCDEKFSYVQTDIEKAVLSVMVSSLGTYEQLFFTTHNTDVLDMPYPKHTFMFMKKNAMDEECPIRILSASDYLKRNTDSLRSAVENDLFGITPDVDALFGLTGAEG